MKKTIIIIAVVFLILIVSLTIYLRSDAFGLRIRQSVVGPLKTVLGESAEIGRVKANFIPLYLEVRDISVPDTRGKQALFVRKIRVYINPWRLLRKEIRLSSISILDPHINAERTKEGAVNLIPLVEQIKSNIARLQSQSAGPSGFSLLLRSITVIQGRIVFQDDMTTTQVSVSGMNMTARFDPSQDHVHLVIRSSPIKASVPSYADFLGNFKATLEYDHGKVRLDSAELTSADASLAVSGDVGPFPDVGLNVKVSVKSGPKTISRFTDLLKPVRKQEASRIEAEALVRGNIADPVITGSLKVPVISFRGMFLQDAALSFGYRKGNIKINGEKWKLTKGDKVIVIDGIETDFGYRDGGLDIMRFDVRAEDLLFHLEGGVGPATGFDASLSVESSGKGRTLTAFTSVPLEGMVGVRGKLSGTLTAPRFDGNVSAGPVKVRGILFDHVGGRLEYENKKVKLSSVDIREHVSRYIFDGSVDLNNNEPLYAARLRVVRSDVVNIVALFYEQLPLRLSAEGELSFEGTAKNYSGSGFLGLESGSAYGETFTKGTITAKLSTGRIAFPQVVLAKDHGSVKASGWIGFDGTYSADLESSEIDLSAIDHLAGAQLGGEFTLDLHSSGSFSLPFVTGSLQLDALSYRQVPVGGMNIEADIKNGLLTAHGDLLDERAALAVRWPLRKPYGWTAEARIKSMTIDPFLLLGKKDLTGRVNVITDGTVTMRGTGLDSSTLSGEALFRQLSLVIGEYRIDNESDARLSIDAGKIVSTTLNFTGPVTKISVTGGVKLPSEIDMTLKGTANLSLLKLLYPEIEHAGGTAEIKLMVKDNLSNPDMSGELRIQNGEIKVKDIPQRFSALNGGIVFSQGRVVVDSLSGEMGGGSLNVSGWVQLDGVAPRDFSAKVAVDNVTVRYPEGLISVLTGDLYYDGDASEQSLSGDVTIKRARYDKRIEWKTMLVDIGRGLYQKKKTDVGWIGETQINVRFHGTNNIVFQNNLATMPLDVDVFLKGTVNHPQLLGRIESKKGLVYFRKNEFKILNASADFVDPNRMNPVLDIQAETRVREYQIRLAVTGTAERAVVTLVSEPSLIDTDILSLLALGKTGTELKGKETGVGVGEAASFATGQFQDIFERRARSLTGLDRFSVDPYVSKNDTSVPRVTAAKELVQNKLYLTYSSNVGAAMPEQIFRIEYLLDRHFSLVGERNEMGNNGADVKYRFEFK